MTVVPLALPAQPPELQDVGGFAGLPGIAPVMGKPLKNPCCPVNVDLSFSTVSQYRIAATMSAPAGTPVAGTEFASGMWMVPVARPFTPKPRKPTPPTT